MKITFKINYKTLWGQKLKITGSLPELGNWSEDKAPEMDIQNPESGNWELTIDTRKKKNLKFEYKYFILFENADAAEYEWGENRQIDLSLANGEDVVFVDSWTPKGRTENVLFSSAFTDALIKPETDRTRKTFNHAKLADDEYIVRLQIDHTRVTPGHKLAVAGSCKSLGEWKANKPQVMKNHTPPKWYTEFVVKKDEFPVEYKYCIYDKKEKSIVTWEETSNKKLELSETIPLGSTIVRTDEKFEFGWNVWKGSGVAIPVFSLRSKNGLGVGEFLDIKLLVDWSKRTGNKLIQILPVNDTVATHTWVDSYPYAAISVFALHPIYCNLQAIGKLSSKISQEIIDEQGRWLNEKGQIDYEGVMRVKARFFKLIYDEQKTDFLKDPDFLKFFKANESWLVPYATFSYLRDLYGTPDFRRWGRFSQPTKKILDELTDPKAPQYDDIAVHYFIQYHLDKQLREASDYARKNGIVLKGDIPIGIYRNSVDAWVAPHLYNMESQAGAPPDDFSDKGQNWKFPTYNWQEMAKDGYQWWQNRLKKMADYFDSFRIDHILGFFRIWEIPIDAVEGILGHFNPAIPIHINEFAEKGIHFDYFRFCKPYIREHMLYPTFGDQTWHVKDKYLNEGDHGYYSFKPEFDTQKKIEEHLQVGPEASNEERSRNEYLKNGLFYLLGEVLFFEAPFSEGRAFNPRHSLFKTRSFAELDEHTRQVIYDIYIDFYYKRNEEFWREQAMVKLPAIKNATNMLICGEDLGMVPDCVPHVMRELEILSLEVQRMPKNPKIKFNHPADYPYLSVATPSSHDTSTIRGWWEEDTSRTQQFYTDILGKEGGSPFFCEPWIVQEIIVQHLYSPSMWAIFPIQDLIGMDEKLRVVDAKSERINNPGNPQHYWRYRMHIALEDLMKEDDFNDMLQNMIKASGRYFDY